MEMNNDCWNTPKGRSKMLGSTRELTKSNHGQVLLKLIHGISDLKTIDLGCGSKKCERLFTDYTGVDLPEWNVHESDCEFISDYDLVLMNAFIDVVEQPLRVLMKVLGKAKNYVVLHRQEITKMPTRKEKRDSYGGWTWHSMIYEKDFYAILKTKGFVIKKRMSCGFENWNEGGTSLLLKKL